MATILILNTVPEDGETGVPIEEIVRLHVVSVDSGVLLDPTVKVYITRTSDGVRRLAYDQASGGFQTPYDHADSNAVYQASPGSGVNDELWLYIKLDGVYTSLEPVLVEVSATSGGATSSTVQSYAFTIEDLTAPVPTEVFWLRPWRCRIKFDEPVKTLTTPGGSAFVTFDSGGVSVVGTNEGDESSTVKLSSTPVAGMVGHYLQMAGSAFPQNQTPRPILSIDAPAKTVQVDTADAYGGPMFADDGRDYDTQGILVRERNLKVAISPYHFSARLDDEGADYDELSAERVQVAYCPMPISATVPDSSELPGGADYRKYVVLELEDDISYGRLYTLHVDGVEDLFDNAAVDAQVDFQSPMFGVDPNRVRIWMHGLTPPPDQVGDLKDQQLLRKMAVILQDTFNMIWYRVDQLQYLHDPDLCPDNWVDFLLYDQANPFRFELSNIAQKRLLAAALPGFYRGLGTEQNIIDMIYLLLGITVQITVYVEADFWTLNTHRLGITTTLGPGTAWARNAYEIISPISLTARQRAVITEVATWADPCNMHLARIIEPGDDGALESYWVLGTSALGLTTKLSG